MRCGWECRGRERRDRRSLHAGGGAGDTPSRRRILTCAARSGAADEERRARRRSCRRSPDAPTGVRSPTPMSQTLLTFYDAGRGEEATGASKPASSVALERLLIDPEFLFRIEHDPADAAAGPAYRISDIELASRLSFFLWSSIPDDELLDLAEPGQAQRSGRARAAGAAYARRRSRATALVENFAGQWLELRNIREHDARPRHASTSSTTTCATRCGERPSCSWRASCREDRSVVELLSANYTFVNERLARHYGIPGVYGERFRRVIVRRRSQLPRAGCSARAAS